MLGVAIFTFTGTILGLATGVAISLGLISLFTIFTCLRGVITVGLTGVPDSGLGAIDFVMKNFRAGSILTVFGVAVAAGVEGIIFCVAIIGLFICIGLAASILIILDVSGGVGDSRGRF